MERKLIVQLLRKHIDELGMITEGFMEMQEYPSAIIGLARRKAEDVLDYIRQLESFRPQTAVQDSPVCGVGVSETAAVYEEPEAAEEVPEVSEAAPVSVSPVSAVEEIPPAEAATVAEASVVVETAEIREAPAEEPFDPAEAVAEQPVPAEVSPAAALRVLSVERSDSTIADRHSQRKIDDIRQAFSIGDRFRFQRELFAGNGELMNKTLAKLNGMSDFDEAVRYLRDKFRWADDDETVESFYQIVRRRY